MKVVVALALLAGGVTVGAIGRGARATAAANLESPVCPAPERVEVRMPIACPRLACPPPEAAEVHDAAGIEGVMLTDDGSPYGETRIALVRGGQTTYVETDEHGRFVLDLPPGTFRVDPPCELATDPGELTIGAGERLQGIELQCKKPPEKPPEREAAENRIHERARECNNICSENGKIAVGAECVERLARARATADTCRMACYDTRQRELKALGPAPGEE